MISSETLSDLFINLAAGWFGAAIILPITIRSNIKLNFTLLLVNILFGIFCLLVAEFFKGFK